MDSGSLLEVLGRCWCLVPPQEVPPSLGTARPPLILCRQVENNRPGGGRKWGQVASEEPWQAPPHTRTEKGTYSSQMADGGDCI